MTCRFDVGEVDDPLAARVRTYASRMFHSRGTVQSNTCVPGRHLVHVERNVLAEPAQRLRARRRR